MAKTTLDILVLEFEKFVQGKYFTVKCEAHWEIAIAYLPSGHYNASPVPGCRSLLWERTGLISSQLTVNISQQTETIIVKPAWYSALQSKFMGSRKTQQPKWCLLVVRVIQYLDPSLSLWNDGLAAQAQAVCWLCSVAAAPRAPGSSSGHHCYTVGTVFTDNTTWQDRYTHIIHTLLLNHITADILVLSKQEEHRGLKQVQPCLALISISSFTQANTGDCG